MTLLIHLLGQPTLLLNSQSLKFNAPPKTILLLAYLLLHRAQPVDRQQVAFLLWPDHSEEAARANLRRHLHHLQRILQAIPADYPWLLSDTQTIRWNPAAEFELDVAEFERLSAAPETLEAAAAGYTGDFLEGEYDDWVLLEQERLRNLYFDVLSRLLFHNRAQRNFAKAITFAQQVLSRDPFREEVVRQLMAVLYETGDRAAAIQAYEIFERRLRDEMGVPPMPETQALREIIVRNGRLPGQSEPPPRAPACPEAPAEPIASAWLPFVGREAEMKQVLAWWKQVSAGQGSLAWIGGEAGVGKSRLVRELALQVEREGGRILFGSTLPGQPRPYQPLVEALESALPLVAALEVNAAHLVALLPLIPELGRRCSLKPLPPLEPEKERVRLFDAIGRCLEQLAGPRPLLLVLEDLHWAGETTLTLVEFLARRVGSHPILIVCTYRDEEVRRGHPLYQMRRRLQGEKLTQRLALRRLSGQAVTCLTAWLAQQPEQFSGLGIQPENRLYAESEGNPLFIEMLLRQWQEHGAETQAVLPGGIKAIIARRLADLPTEARAYAEVAAVVGTAFEAEVVREVGGWDEARAFAALGTLLDHHLAGDAASRSVFDYVFAHHLIQSTLYAEIPSARRKRRHLRTAEVLQELYPDRHNELAGELAYHYDRGGQVERAIPCYLASARQHLQVFADGEALAALKRAQALAASALSPEAQRSLFELLLLRVDIYRRRGNRPEQGADLKQLEQLAAALNDPERVCQVLREQILYQRSLSEHSTEQALITEFKHRADVTGRLYWKAEALMAEGIHKKITDQSDLASALIQQAFQLRQELGDVDGQLYCCCHLAEMAIKFRRIPESEPWIQKALALCDEQHITEQLMWTLWTVAANGLITLDLPRCLKYAYKLLPLAERAAALNWQAAAHRLLGQTYIRLFGIREARQHLEAALELYMRVQSAKMRALSLESLGLLAITLGRLTEGQNYFEQALKIILEKQLGPSNAATEYINLAETASLREDFDLEKNWALQGVKCSQQAGDTYLEGHALYNLGEAERELGDLDSAIQHMREARAIFLKLEMLLETPAVLGDLALGYLMAGRLPEALDCVTDLLAIFPEIVDKRDDPQRLLWAAVRVLRAAGQSERAAELLAQAYRIIQQKLAMIPDLESRETYAQLAFNRQISAAYSLAEQLQKG
jgi:DNA-binding SARP family transcriptional activator